MQYRDYEADPLNPTVRMSVSDLGEVHALKGTVHTSHAAVKNPDRQKTYLIATYTSVLDETDVDHEWFVPHQLRPDQVCDAQERPLRADSGDVDHALIKTIDDAHAQGRGAVYFDHDPAIEGTNVGSAPWSGYEVGPSSTSPHTDAGVSIRLHGTKGEGGSERDPLRLVHEGEDAEIFRPGHCDEFCVTCPDIGDLQALTVTVDSNGRDWSSSMWKLDKVVVTCLQSHKGGGDESGLGYWSPRGDNVDKSMTTTESSQWHFVPRQQWLGCTPRSTAAEEAELRRQLMEEARLQQELEEVVSASSSSR
jgi:hypothetical protein